jgi:hypothetical protein
LAAARFTSRVCVRVSPPHTESVGHADHADQLPGTQSTTHGFNAHCSRFTSVEHALPPLRAGRTVDHVNVRTPTPHAPVHADARRSHTASDGGGGGGSGQSRV